MGSKNGLFKRVVQSTLPGAALRLACSATALVCVAGATRVVRI